MNAICQTLLAEKCQTRARGSKNRNAFMALPTGVEPVFSD